MTDLDALWRRLAAGHPSAEGRKDFRADPAFADAEAKGGPINLYRRLRQKHAGIDKLLPRLVTEPDLRAALAAEVPGSVELAFELISLGAPVDERVSNFSKSFYLDHHPDVRRLGMDPLQHYLLHGQKQNRWTLEAQRRMERPGARPFDPTRPTCLIAVHEMTGTGAPMVGLDLVREAARSHNVIVASLEDGPLLPALAEQAVAVLIAARPMASLRHATCLRGVDVAFALLNSVACAPFVPWLVGAAIPFLTYVHEFPDYMRPAWRTSHVALFSDLLAFSSETLRTSWRDILADHAVADGDTVILPQRPFRVGRATAGGIHTAREELSRALGRDLTGVRLVCGAGLMQWRKGTDLFATAAMVARPRDPGALFVWIGGSPDADDINFGAWMRRHLAVAGAGDPESNLVVLPAGPLYGPLLRAADAMFLPSRLDPLPNVVFDAIEAGTRVVLFDGATGFDDRDYRRSGVFSYVPYGDAAAAVEVLLALPRKAPRDGEPALPEAPPLFATLHRSLRERLDRRRHFVLGRGAFDASVLFGGKPEHRALREREREKLFGLRRRILWRDLPEVREALEGSGSWVHAAVRVGTYAPAAAGALPRFRVHLHAYHVEEVPGLLGAHGLLRHAERILVTTDSEAKSRSLRDGAAPLGMDVEVLVVPNRGRDVLPFLDLLRSERRPGGDDLWCHIHAKRSAETTSQGASWRDFLLRTLLGAGEELSNAPVLLAEGATGLVAPLDPSVLGWTDSRPLLPRVEARLGRPLPAHPLVFPMGNMFWVRGEVVDAMAGLFGDGYPWPGEPIPNDGTEYHLIERLWPAVAASRGLGSVFLHKPGERRS